MRGLRLERLGERIARPLGIVEAVAAEAAELAPALRRGAAILAGESRAGLQQLRSFLGGAELEQTVADREQHLAVARGLALRLAQQREGALGIAALQVQLGGLDEQARGSVLARQRDGALEDLAQPRPVGHAARELAERIVDRQVVRIQIVRAVQPQPRGLRLVEALQVELADLGRERRCAAVRLGLAVEAPLEQVGEQVPLLAGRRVQGERLDRIGVVRVVGQGAPGTARPRDPTARAGPSRAARRRPAPRRDLPGAQLREPLRSPPPPRRGDPPPAAPGPGRAARPDAGRRSRARARSTRARARRCASGRAPDGGWISASRLARSAGSVAVRSSSSATFSA